MLKANPLPPLLACDRYAKFRDAPEQDEDVHFEIKRQLEMDELKAQTGKKGKGLKGKLAGMMKKKTPKKTKTKDPSDDPLYCTLCKKQFKDVDKFQVEEDAGDDDNDHDEWS